MIFDNTLGDDRPNPDSPPSFDLAANSKIALKEYLNLFQIKYL